MFDILASNQVDVWGFALEHIVAIIIFVWSLTFGCYALALKTEGGQKKYIKLLRLEGDEKTFSSWRDVYREKLSSVLEIFNRWCGSPFGGQALFFNTFIAIFYVLLFFVLSWLIGGSGKLGSIQILPEINSVATRVFGVLFLIAVLVAVRESKNTVLYILTLFSLEVSKSMEKVLTAVVIGLVVVVVLLGLGGVGLVGVVIGLGIVGLVGRGLREGVEVGLIAAVAAVAAVVVVVIGEGVVGGGVGIVVGGAILGLVVILREEELEEGLILEGVGLLLGLVVVVGVVGATFGLIIGIIVKVVGVGIGGLLLAVVLGALIVVSVIRLV